MFQRSVLTFQSGIRFFNKICCYDLVSNLRSFLTEKFHKRTSLPISDPVFTFIVIHRQISKNYLTKIVHGRTVCDFREPLIQCFNSSLLALYLRELNDGIQRWNF